MVQVLLSTFNCGKEIQTSDQVAQVVKSAKAAAVKAGAGTGSGEANSHAIAVFALQEFCPILEASFGQHSKYLDPILSGISQGLGSSYTRVGIKVLGATVLIVYTDPSTLSVTNFSTASAPCGMGYSNLKGGVGARLKVRLHSGSVEKELTFVGAHLAANEGLVEERNRNFYQIVTGLDFGDGHGAYKPGSHLFFMGDLNYRAKRVLGSLTQRDEGTGVSGSGSGSDGDGASDGADVHLLDTHDASVDELTDEIEQGKTMFGLEEAPIKFNPTYKFVVNSAKYNLKRTPSWCDRILYLPGQTAKDISVTSYGSLFDITWSDHRPVYLSVTVSSTSTPSSVLTSDSHLALTDKAYPPHLFLGLDPNRSSISTYGGLADRAIGWSLYLSQTRGGNSVAVLAVLLMFLAYRAL